MNLTVLRGILTSFTLRSHFDHLEPIRTSFLHRATPKCSPQRLNYRAPCNTKNGVDLNGFGAQAELNFDFDSNLCLQSITDTKDSWCVQSWWWYRRRYLVCCWAGRKMDAETLIWWLLRAEFGDLPNAESSSVWDGAFARSLNQQLNIPFMGKSRRASIHTLMQSDLTGVIHSMGLFWFDCIHLLVRRLALARFNFSAGKKVFFSH